MQPAIGAMAKVYVMEGQRADVSREDLVRDACRRANQDGKAVVFFRDAAKFKERYAMQTGLNYFGDDRGSMSA